MSGRAAVQARVTVVDRQDRIVGKLLDGPTVEAVQRKIDKLDERGVLVRVEAWSDEA